MSRVLDNRDTMPRWLLPNRGIGIGMCLAFLALLPFGGLYNIPLLVLCGLGLRCLVSRPREVLEDDGMRLLLTLFLCIWLPMIISAVDGLNPVQSWRKVVSFPVFFLASIYVVKAIRCKSDLWRLLIGVWTISIFWSVDASWQFIHGFNLFGFPYHGERVSGIFYPKLKLGIVLAVVSPLILEAMRQLAGRSLWLVLALIPFFAAIILSGSRSSWLVLLVVLGVYGWYLFRWAEAPNMHRRAILRVAAVGVLACGVLAYSFPQAADRMHGLFVKRVTPVVSLMNGDREKVDHAIEARFSAWKIAGRVFRAHWFNGVGPRGFREAYADFASESDFYVSRGRVMNYPHLLVLEIMAETGVVGLLGYVIALTALVRRLLAMDRAQLAHGFPYLLAIVIVLFPPATHEAFYAHFMGALIWWVIAISSAGFGAVMRDGRRVA